MNHLGHWLIFLCSIEFSEPFFMNSFHRLFSRLSMAKTPVTVVVALDDANGIGRDNRLPWTIKNDLKFFRYVTSKVQDPNKQNAIIIGRKTFETFS